MVLTKDLIKKSEESAVLSGAFSFRELMFTAGTRAAEIIARKYGCSNKKVALLIGNGNNGGDGCVIADYLYSHGADVTVITPLGEPKTENAKYYYDKLAFVKKAKTLEGDFDIIIDALFGIGLNRAPDRKITDLLKKVNAANSARIAIDLPSGIDCDSGRIWDTCFDAQLTVTFIALKPCFLLPPGSDYCGEVIVADIGVKPIKAEYEIIKEPVFPKRRHNSHKGTFGTALLICGSYGMAGAAVLSAKAAMRSGVGIAKCMLCDGIYPAFTSCLPEAVCIPVKQTGQGSLNGDINIKELTENASALLFGCGVSQTEDTSKILKEIIENVNIPTVIDADGINLLSRSIGLLEKVKAPIVLTPHPAEMARLCKTDVKSIEADRIGYAKEFAAKHNCTLILKGANTVVAEPQGKISLNIKGNPGMATAGSGDVLAGVLVSLLAQGMSVTEASKAAVYLHSLAGDKALAKRGERAVIASDIIEEL